MKIHSTWLFRTEAKLSPFTELTFKHCFTISKASNMKWMFLKYSFPFISTKNTRSKITLLDKVRFQLQNTNFRQSHYNWLCIFTNNKIPPVFVLHKYVLSHPSISPLPNWAHIHSLFSLNFQQALMIINGWLLFI